jgi:hypothetical protein
MMDELINLIDVELLKNAKLSGIAFGRIHQGLGEIPFISPVFASKHHAELIFKDWIAKLGSHDEANFLRIALVMEPPVENEQGCVLRISANPETITKKMIEENPFGNRPFGFKFDSIIYKFNLNRVLRSFQVFKFMYEANGAYFIAPEIYHSPNNVELLDKYKILKHNIVFENLSELTAADIDYDILPFMKRTSSPPNLMN